jgi:xanthine dehydrogenase small subunit
MTRATAGKDPSVRDSVEFLLGHERRSLRGVDPTLTVLDYLRTHEHRKGTKEGCAEGDCGACTVVLARPAGGRLDYRAVNACIQLVPTLDGCQVLTVEDLQGPDGALHPVQRALVEAHGSQCGFCTPGFVMSLFPLWREGGRATRAEIADRLAGNLCRCTGYGPILAAAERLADTPGATAHLLEREADVLAELEALADERTLQVERGGRRFLAPSTLDALADLLLAHPGATVLAGSTDVGLWITKQDRQLETIIWIGRVAELRAIRAGTDAIEIGAGVTCTDGMAALAQEWPDMGEVYRRYASPPIRNTATIGGNIANGSPIGDSAPMLIAASAMLVLRRGRQRRQLPLEQFFLAYGKQDRRPDELIEAVIVPRRRPEQRFRAYKVSKRFDQDISAVLGAFTITLDGDRVREARIAYGGMAATPKRALAAEAALRGRAWDEPAVRAAMAALAEDFKPITDMRASAGYRLQVARNLLFKAWLETTDPGAETRLVGDRRLAHA